MNRRKVMIVGAGPLQIPAISKAKEMGLEVIVIDINPEAPGIAIADSYAIVSTLDVPAAIAVAKEVGLCGVLTLATDAPVKTVAAIGNELSLNAVSIETAIVATNKAYMRQRLEKCGVPIPWFFVIPDYDTF
jgi:phosphoribosylaminoimidazole carboxylase (NCAIR synthetase)